MPAAPSARTSLSRRHSQHHRTTSNVTPANGRVVHRRKSSRSSSSPRSTSKQHAAIIAAANFAARRTSSLRNSTSATNNTYSLPAFPSNTDVFLYEDEYEEEIIESCLAVEAVTLPDLAKMKMQPELTLDMRGPLVHFLMDTQSTLGLRRETLFLALNIVDRYVSKCVVYADHYEMVGAVALLIAAKYEDNKDRVPTVPYLQSLCKNPFQQEVFVKMETHILDTLGWQLGHTTPLAWLRLYGKQTQETQETLDVAQFLLEFSLLHIAFIQVPSSMLAAGALQTARSILQAGPRQFPGIQEEIGPIANLFDAYLCSDMEYASLLLVTRYSFGRLGRVPDIIMSYCFRRTDEQRRERLAAEGVSPASTVADSFTAPFHTFRDDTDPDCTASSESFASSPSSMSSPSSWYSENDMPFTPDLAELPSTMLPSDAAVKGDEETFAREEVADNHNNKHIPATTGCVTAAMATWQPLA